MLQFSNNCSFCFLLLRDLPLILWKPEIHVCIFISSLPQLRIKHSAFYTSCDKRKILISINVYGMYTYLEVDTLEVQSQMSFEKISCTRFAKPVSKLLEYTGSNLDFDLQITRSVYKYFPLAWKNNSGFQKCLISGPLCDNERLCNFMFVVVVDESIITKISAMTE